MLCDLRSINISPCINDDYGMRIVLMLLWIGTITLILSSSIGYAKIQSS